MNTDPIADSLGLTPINNIPLSMPVVNTYGDKQVDDDFEYARGNMISAFEKGQEALSGVLEVAGMSQHPRAYEVAATLVKTLADANKDLLELQKKNKDIMKSDDATQNNVTNNNLILTTGDLLKMIKNNE